MFADPCVSVGVNARGPWGQCEAAGAAAAAMPPGRALLLRLRQLDAYPKPLDDFRVKTFGGAAVTIVSGLIMSVLFLSELQYYLTKEVHPELFVDTTRGDKLRINLDVVFPRMACAFLSLDAMDVSGETQIDVEHTLFKKRLDARGQPVAAEEEKHEIGKLEEIPDPTALDPNRCESCYGANGTDLQCCNTCDDVREAYRRKGWAFKNPEVIEQCRREGFSNKVREQKDEGCRVYGHLEVNKVAGNFHFAPGKSFQQAHIHDFMMFQYFVKIVPTVYVKLNGEALRTNQFSVTKHEKVANGLAGDQGLPGVFVSYELSPMMVRFTEKQRSFTHFLTGVCAIIGGVFTVAGLIDSMIYHSARAIQKKIDLGKTT
ncbi:endoplasmic reticulum-Golgi intermediate compartment protein 3-like isoform X3 [Lethenteron reissneri]|uniref:endoplasmic reticulum-Golgi intermediate compartment protein 3-like isoform X3 n=1 Tax=Lethenteron reissneri TaxID=7753 RepID=UPI002AB78AF8|nr:endoplasmic reticulum-Golgi intermediate compartment protein 3-like isoform X3 [Lethenteron reissneri]